MPYRSECTSRWDLKCGAQRALPQGALSLDFAANFVCCGRMRRIRAPTMTITPAYWKTVPRRSLFLFLFGVFCIFSTIGFASDILEMGRQQTPRFVLSVLMAGVFPTFYALSGFILKTNFWKAFLPLFAVHFMLMQLV